MDRDQTATSARRSASPGAVRLRSGLLLLALFAGCSTTPNDASASETTSEPVDISTTAPPTTATTTTEPLEDQRRVLTGAAVLVDRGFDLIDGRRVGLISHQNSVVASRHLADWLHDAPNVELVALFGPEHGARGDADAGEYVADVVDPSTGVPVFSLYGPTRQPTPEMLDGIDVLLYDLQDVGARYYTYISTMGLAMQAANDAGIEFMVLDRPNPLGGQVGGGRLNGGYASFVGMYTIPDLYGLTPGELATWIAAGLLPKLNDLDLSVVEMIGWNHEMLWEDTGLEWIAPSPAMTTPDAALVYPATIYFEALTLSYGRGTDTPFQVIGAPWLDADALVADLIGRRLGGIGFTATTISPQMLAGMTVEPAFLGETIPAVRLSVTDAHALRPTEVGVHLLDAVFNQADAAGVDPLARPDWLDQLSGGPLLRRFVTDQPRDVEEILVLHRRAQSQREAGRQASLLYD